MEFISITVQFDESLVSPEFICEHIAELEGVYQIQEN